MSRLGKVLAVAAAVGLSIGLAPAASAGEGPALVHATVTNDCKLNVRTEPQLSGTLLATLTCVNYTTCVNLETAPEEPCGKPVVGGEYTCVGGKNTQVKDNRWLEVAWRAPKPSYVAAACASFRK
ncbi:hypothetical protein [Amycolatopsis albispora]|uniref:hypothetical protein n=1 Tax=Amycolatopsis albispora TaxID=1804986 RepID=UPI001F3200EA|nr:hypothetical protein [Amycolatopsis albispora]